MSLGLTILCPDAAEIADLQALFDDRDVIWEGSRSFVVKSGNEGPQLRIGIGWDHESDLQSQISEMASDPGFPSHRRDLRIFYVSTVRHNPGNLLLLKFVDHPNIWVDHFRRLVHGPEFASALTQVPEWDWESDLFPNRPKTSD